MSAIFKMVAKTWHKKLAVKIEQLGQMEPNLAVS
jgi:hypothetical protein